MKRTFNDIITKTINRCGYVSVYVNDCWCCENEFKIDIGLWLKEHFDSSEYELEFYNDLFNATYVNEETTIIRNVIIKLKRRENDIQSIYYKLNELNKEIEEHEANIKAARDALQEMYSKRYVPRKDGDIYSCYVNDYINREMRKYEFQKGDIL